jgi:hypothetical protein
MRFNNTVQVLMFVVFLFRFCVLSVLTAPCDFSDLRYRRNLLREPNEGTAEAQRDQGVLTSMHTSAMFEKKWRAFADSFQSGHTVAMATS